MKANFHQISAPDGKFWLKINDDCIRGPTENKPKRDHNAPPNNDEKSPEQAKGLPGLIKSSAAIPPLCVGIAVLAGGKREHRAEPGNSAAVQRLGTAKGARAARKKRVQRR